MVDGLEARRARKLRSEQRLAAEVKPAVAVEEFVLDEEKEGAAAREARRARLEQRAAAETAKHDSEEAERLQRVAAACEKRRAERVANCEVGPEAKKKKAAEKEAKKKAALDEAWNERADRWRNVTEQEEASRTAAEEARRKFDEEKAEADMARLQAAQKQLEVEEERVRIWRLTGQSEATASQMRYLGEERSEAVKSWGWTQLENGKVAYGFTRGGDQVTKTLKALGIEDIRQTSSGGGALALEDQGATLALEDAGSTAPSSPTPTVAMQASVMPAETTPVPTAALLETPPAELIEQHVVGEDSVSTLPQDMSEINLQVPAQIVNATGDGATGDGTIAGKCPDRSSTPQSDASDSSEEEAQVILASTADGSELRASNGICGEQPWSEVSTGDVPGIPLSPDDGLSARDARQLARCRRIAEAAAARRARVAKRRARHGTTNLEDGLGPQVAREPG